MLLLRRSFRRPTPALFLHHLHQPIATFSNFVVPNSASGPNGAIHKSSIKIPEQLDATSIYQNFQLGASLNPHNNCLGFRPKLHTNGEVGPYEWLSYEQTNKRLHNFGAGLMALNCVPEVDAGKDGSLRLMAIYMKNCPEWVISSIGHFSIGGTVVPLFDSLGESSTGFILNQTKLSTVVCSLGEFKKLLNIAEDVPTLKNVIICGERKKSLEDVAKRELGLNVYGIEEVEEIGSNKPISVVESSPDDIALLMYTSGTTGNPKGAMLTHEAQLTCAAAFRCHIATFLPNIFSSKLVHLSYLPLAHILENFIHIIVYKEGGSVGFYQGNPLKLVDDLTKLRPTCFISVPRLLNKIYDNIMHAVEQGNPVKRFLFNKALQTKREGLTKGFYTHPFWDFIVFSPLRRRLGLDRVELIVTGSSPIADDVLSFLRASFMVPVLEGYGQTETGGATSCTDAADFTAGSVGGALPCSEIKLVSVPDMGYNVSDTFHGKEEEGNLIPCDGRGEICVRGKHTFKGYFKMPNETEDCVDSEGWVHSGDIGMWTLDGKVKIIDRKKNIFKLSQGEYVAPEKIENILSTSQYVAQVFVYGDSLHSLLVGIVVPDESFLIKLANDLGVPYGGDWEELCTKEKLIAYFLKEMKDISKSHKLTGYETVKQVLLTPEPFTVGNNLLTPTFKLRRAFAKTFYAKEIKQLYDCTSDSIAGKKFGSKFLELEKPSM